MIVTALFTKDEGDPATGLALADIDIYLSSRNKSTGAVAVVWAGENPTEELCVGLYSKAYAEDTMTYDYFAYAEYTGATTLDSNYSLQTTPMEGDADELIEGTLTIRTLLRIVLAVLAGKSHGGGTLLVRFRDEADAKDRVSAIVTGDGDRTAVVLDGS